jgi:hypothetical protein
MYSGSPTWTRTRGLRINSLIKCLFFIENWFALTRHVSREIVRIFTDIYRLPKAVCESLQPSEELFTEELLNYAMASSFTRWFSI